MSPTPTKKCEHVIAGVARTAKKVTSRLRSRRRDPQSGGSYWARGIIVRGLESSYCQIGNPARRLIGGDTIPLLNHAEPAIGLMP